MYIHPLIVARYSVYTPNLESERVSFWVEKESRVVLGTVQKVQGREKPLKE